MQARQICISDVHNAHAQLHMHTTHLPRQIAKCKTYPALCVREYCQGFFHHGFVSFSELASAVFSSFSHLFLLLLLLLLLFLFSFLHLLRRRHRRRRAMEAVDDAKAAAATADESVRGSEAAAVEVWPRQVQVHED